MGSLPIKKVALLFPKDRLREVIACLQRSACLEIVQVTETAPPTEAVQDEGVLPGLKEAIDFLTVRNRRQKGFLNNFLALPDLISERDFQRQISGYDQAAESDQIRELKNKLEDWRRKSEQLRSDEAHYALWRGLKMPLTGLRGSRHTGVVAGSLPRKQWQKLRSDWPFGLADCQIEEVSRDKTRQRLVLVYHRAGEKRIKETLALYDFSAADFPVSPLTVEQLLDQNRQDQEACRRHEGSLSAQALAFIPRLPLLRLVYDHCLIQKGQTEVLTKTGQTSRTSLIKGWMSRQDEAGLEKELRRITPVVFMEVAPDEGETPPVILHNARLFEPFEAITRMFGAPAPRETDPSTILGIYFLIFFGFCLGDIGYGLLLAASTFWLLRRPNLAWGARAVLRFLFWGGWASVIAGTLVGSFFGVDLGSIPPSWGWIRQLLLSLRIFNPMVSPLRLLFFSFALGISQIITGLFIQFINNCKSRDYLSAFCDSLGWIFFLLAILFYGGCLVFWPAGRTLALVLVGSGALQLVLTQGRHKPTLLEKFGSGVLSLYKLSGFLGDVLSYSRILALGMTSSVIGMVVNMIAKMAWSGPPVLGAVLALVIIAAGHALNFLISVLGATIHSIRLQLVEFFGKFFIGGGKIFKPFGRETRYYLID